MDKQTDLISRLQDEADLCRNDGANDIAALLDEAVEALRDRNHDTAVGEKWRTDSRLEEWFPLTAERLAKLAPLTREQIDAVMTEHYPLSSLLREEVDAFEACVRDLERLHGIGA